MITVLIVGDIRLYREGLARLLDRPGEFRVLGTAQRREEAVHETRRLRPHVVLLDLTMADGLAAIRGIVAAEPETKVIALTVPETEREVVACAMAGASGYVPREASVEDLLSTVESVSRGELRCSPRIAAKLLYRVARLAAAIDVDPADVGLTPREREVAHLLEAGMSNKAIAKQLGIEVATAKNHVHRILEKLGVHRRAQAVARLRACLQRP